MTTKSTKTSGAKKNRSKALAKAAAKIREDLGLVTLRTRGRDGLDFHDISVAAIRDAIETAFAAGWDAGFEAGKTLHK
jgi:hypothetical protein